MHRARNVVGNKLTFKQLIVAIVGPAMIKEGHKESQMCECLCICCIAVAAKKIEPKEKVTTATVVPDITAFSSPIRSLVHSSKVFSVPNPLGIRMPSSHAHRHPPFC